MGYTVTATSADTGNVIAMRDADDLDGALVAKSSLFKFFHRAATPATDNLSDWDDWDARNTSIPVSITLTPKN